MTTAIIADDETILLYHLKQMLLDLWPELDIHGTYTNGEDALLACQSTDVDIVFTDIKMPKMNGLELANKLQNTKTHIVFITAYSEHAVKAFDQAAVDYILKPVQETRLQKTVLRLQEKVSSQDSPLPNLSALLSQLQSVQAPTQQRFLKWLKVSHNEAIEIIPVTDILYFEASDKYTTVRTLSREYIIRTPLKNLETELDPDQFWRVHRNCIVQVAVIESVKNDLTGGLWLSVKGDKKRVKVSRRYASLFRQQ